MLGVVIAVCLGILVGMALASNTIARNRRNRMARERARLAAIRPADAGTRASSVEPVVDAAVVDEIARDAALSDEERATFEQIFRENFPDAAGPPQAD